MFVMFLFTIMLLILVLPVVIFVNCCFFWFAFEGIHLKGLTFSDCVLIKDTFYTLCFLCCQDMYGTVMFSNRSP